MTERRFHTDSRVGENFTKDGLETLTGQPSQKWGRYVVKEILDNALEAVEEADTEMPTVTVDADVVEHGVNTFIREITIADNGDGIPESQINQIADVERFGGTKRHYALPTRGTQGNALMTVLGIQHLADGELVIETHGQCHVFSVNADTLSGAPTVDVDTVDGEFVDTVTAPSAASDGGVSADGTAVTVNFGDKGEHWAVRSHRQNAAWVCRTESTRSISDPTGSEQSGCRYDNTVSAERISNNRTRSLDVTAGVPGTYQG